MRRSFTPIILVTIAALIWLEPSGAYAQDFCADIRRAIGAAPTEFAAYKGSPIQVDNSALRVFASLQALSGAGDCSVAEQDFEGRRFSTSYTCTNTAPDTDAGMTALTDRLRTCLNVTEWAEQQDGSGTRVSQYGLFRLSVTRNGAQGGLALGVEAFRDEHGQVMGSPTRGDVVDAEGRHRCISRAPEAIDAMIAEYATHPGAERFEDRQFVGYSNRTSHPTVAFVTKPAHPAHPALIVRDITQRDGQTVVSAEGDFAGDCQAFQELLQQVIDMNRNLRR